MTWNSLKLTRRKMMLLMGLSCAAAGSCALRPKIGPLPDGQRLERIRTSPNHAGGEFHNQLPTELFTGEGGRAASMWDFLFVPKDRLKPDHPLPVVATDLRGLAGRDGSVVWLGHSSLFLRIGGSTILIDPVFGSYAAPFFFMNRAFAGDYPYSAHAMPEVDCLIISHDHWDHLDHATLTALRPRVKAVVCPLGVGAILEEWGFDPAIIHEADWDESVQPGRNLTVHVLPARHFSGRWFSRNKTLWAGFMIEAAGRRVFYSGDSGYGPHFAQIGEKFGPVDLAIMENGQYDPSWKNIHMMPEEAAQGAMDLRARALLPVHSGRFCISNHAWDAPYERITAASVEKPFRLLTPRIGEVIDMDNESQLFGSWWKAARQGDGRA